MEIQLNLTQAETTSILKMLDIAIRAEGLKIAPEAMILVQKLQQATKDNKAKKDLENGK